MSMPGWYPDPAGTPNRFRYWDGQSWSEQTTDNPASQPPTQPSLGREAGPLLGSGLPAGGSTKQRRIAPLLAVVAAVAVAAVVGTMIFRGLSGPTATDPSALPSPTSSGWDDSSPTATPSPPSLEPTAPTPRPTPSRATKPALQPCPIGQPDARQDHPADGRIHGGELSFPRVAGWTVDDSTPYTWAYDVGSQSELVLKPDWYSSLAVGALFTGDGFDHPRRAAELVLECVQLSGLYPDFAGRKEIWSKPIVVDGHPAWSIRAEIEVDDPDLDTKGDVVEVIVVDTDSPESLSMFIGTVNIGDRELLRTLDTTVAKLRVS